MAILRFEDEEVAQAAGAQPTIHGVNMDGALVQYITKAGTFPTVNDDAAAGYFVGNIWIRLDTNERWQLDDSTNGAAVWSVMAGKVLQVINAQHTASTITTSTAYTTTGLAAAITPKSASSKILCIVSQAISPITAGSSSAQWAQVGLRRNGSIIFEDRRVSMVGQYNHTTPNMTVLDSPATTGTISYSTVFLTSDAAFAVEAQHASLRTSSITLMEITA